MEDEKDAAFNEKMKAFEEKMGIHDQDSQEDFVDGEEFVATGEL